MGQRVHLEDIAARYWTLLCRQSPITAILAGEAQHDNVLLREATEDYACRFEAAKILLEEIDAQTTAELSHKDRDLQTLLAHELRLIIEAYDLKLHLRPSLFPLGPEYLITYFASQTTVSTIDDARRYNERLESVTDALIGVQRSLGEGLAAGMKYPRLVMERAIANVRGQVSGSVEQSAFYAPFAKISNKSDAISDAAFACAQIIQDTIFVAFNNYANFLESELLPVARESISCTDAQQGTELYCNLIKQNVTKDIDPESLHSLGLSEVQRLTAEMDNVAACAGFAGNLEGFRLKLQTDESLIAPDSDNLRQHIEILSKRIDARIPEFFGHIPRATYGIRSIPESIANSMPPAYAQPNPADNSSAGIHWITSIPAKLPSHLHTPIALHEAWPGHLMHIALMQEMTDLPAFLRYGGARYSACVEGWALYCEWLGEEMGLYDSAEKRFGRLETEMWRAVRLVVDTGIHVKAWSRERAIQYCHAHLSLPASLVDAEIDRYISLPAQALAYQVGNLHFREMRSQAEERLGDSFNVRKFHDALMAAGPATLDVLAGVIERWIEVQGKAGVANTV